MSGGMQPQLIAHNPQNKAPTKQKDITMIHIVFQEADAATLAKSFALDPSLEGLILAIGDDYAVGPVQDLFTETGREERNQFWKEVLSGGDYDGLVESGKVQDDTIVQQLKEQLNANPKEIVWIWAAQNKHDVCGYYWLISQLKEYAGRIFILYLNNLPFINEKGNIFYPDNLFQIPPKEFVKAKKLARPVTVSEFEVDSDEWSRLSAEGKGVRLLEGGKKIVQAEYDYYDASLAGFISQDWQKASRIIHQFLNKAKATTGDAFLLWRLKAILADGNYEIQGQPKGMKDFEIKARLPNTENVPQ